MFYRKVHNDRVYYKGKYYVFPRHILRIRAGENRELIDNFYKFLIKQPRVGFKETDNDKVIRTWSKDLFPVFGSHSSLYYWYEEGYYFSEFLELV